MTAPLGPVHTQRRGLVGRLQRAVIAPWLDVLYYWLDLKTAPAPGEEHGHPDHNKVMSSIAFFFGLVGLAVFGRTTLQLCGAVERLLTASMQTGHSPVVAEALSQLVKACALMTTALLAYAALVFGMAFGYAGFRTWAKTKGGGTTDALGKAAEAAASAEIAARREQGGGEYEVTP